MTIRTRQSILEAADRMLHTQGLARLTTKELAQEAGCAEGTLYKHFASKEELILAAVAAHLPDVLLVVQADRAGQHTVAANLEALAQAAIRYYEQLLPPATSLFADMTLLASFRQWMQAQQAGPLSLYERVAEYIAAEAQLGRLAPPAGAFAFAAALLGPCFQYAFIRYFQGADPFPVAEQTFITDLVRTLLGASLPQPA